MLSIEVKQIKLKLKSAILNEVKTNNKLTKITQ